jgi:sorbitol/mannitol transport system substrate-binding protein
MNNLKSKMSTFSTPLKRAGALSATAALLGACTIMGGGAAASASSPTTTVRIAIVSNPQMADIEQLTPYFEREYPNIKVVYDTLPEDTERALIETDIATQANEFNAVMISNYETPIWAKDGWLVNLSQKFANKDAAYDVSDLVKPIATSLSYDGSLYSVPFYGESSFVMYRKSMLAAAGLTMPVHPTWTQIAAMAAKLNNPSKGISGICLRGESGWGENLAPLDTVINTFGGSWFNLKWAPQLTSAADESAVNFYVNLVKKDGEPGASNDGFTECLNYFDSGKAAMWYDATSAAGDIAGAAPKVYADTGYAWAPTGSTGIKSGWQYTWSLSIPNGTPDQQATWDFISWATSKQYIQLVGQKLGWAQLPPGSRESTYALPQYQKAAGAYADVTLQSMEAANPSHPTAMPVPYTGIQFVDIPEFINLGTEVSQQISAAVAGRESVSAALSVSQQDAVSTVAQNGL